MLSESIQVDDEKHFGMLASEKPITVRLWKKTQTSGASLSIEIAQDFSEILYI